MNIDYDKISNLLERVTSGNAGEVYVSFYPESESCTITWKRPRGLMVHKSYPSRVDMLLYVKDLLTNAGVCVSISMEVTQEDFLQED